MNWIMKTRGFFREVLEEFKKCTRPTTAELKESTMVIVVTMAVLGVVIFGSDLVINKVLGMILGS
jgi:preprotein translocase SecE subunit